MKKVWSNYFRITVAAGIGKRFAIGIAIDRWSASIDFLCFWMAVEW